VHCTEQSIAAVLLLRTDGLVCQCPQPG